DCAIIGEGERTFSDLVRALGNDDDFNTIRGIAVLKDTTVVRTPVQPFIDDLDEIPFPAWDLIDIDRYSHCGVLLMNTMLAGRRYMGVFTSRGCPYQCVFCHNIFGKSWRKRSAENVFAEIKVLHDTYGVDEIHFFDDIFNLDRERVKKICDLIIQDGMHVRLAFPNALRADILDRETVLKLKEAGAYAITFALETSSVRLQKMLHKNIDLDVLSEMIVYSSKIGLLTKCYTMLGFPTETEEEMTGTIDFVCNLPLEAASFFVVTPQKGTPMYAMIQCMFPDFSVNFNQYNYYMPNNRYEKLLGLPISQFQRKAYRKFFFNIPRLLRLWRKTPRKEYLFRCLGPFCSRVVSILSREK
ncbi:MAG TPA: radical SAM protein, partial [Candidatus Omnitrophota bacterium]|nr:radical SAM protein [Candidatus Omnitrophota bacterium]